jgi:nucleoside-diphosphate-sugar epimerase
MKIIITGALGHIGSKLIRSLEVPNEEVEFILIDNLRTQRFCSLFNLPKDHANYKFFDLDLISSDLDQIFSEASHVIHLAALTDAAGSFDNAAEVESVNLTSTQKVVDLCIKHGLKLINISSTSVYGTQKNIVDESCTDEELNPQSPYARTKLLEEQLIQQHCKSGLLKGVIFRFGTIFGTSPGIRFHTAVNKFCFQAATKVPITVWKTAYDQQRPYLDIDDAINAFEFVITNNIFDGEIYNIVSMNATVKQILNIIEQIIPDLKIEFVENEIMNQLSYTVLADKIENIGFNFHGSLDKQIANTLNLFSAIKN